MENQHYEKAIFAGGCFGAWHHPFYDAEEYHQDYHEKEPEAYKADRKISGRDEYWAIFEE